jgi:hypothetical protein
MAVYQTAELTGTVVGVRTGATLLRKIKVKATVFDSPVLYIQIWNTASGSVTIGTTAPIMVLQVPAGDAVTPLKEQTFIFVGPKGGMLLSTALSIACTTTHDGSTAPDAGDRPHVTVDYAAIG